MRKLLEYNETANLRFIEWFLSQNHFDEQNHLWISHIIDAQELWNARIKDRDAQLGVWELIHPNSLPEWNRRVSAESVDIVEHYEMNTPIDYINTNGQAFSSSIEEIMLHLFGHGNYHRGQLASRIRKMDLDPPYTDYIEFCRAGF